MFVVSANSNAKVFKLKLNSNLKIFLLSLAVVNDLIFILAIVFLYSARINITAVMISVVILLILMSLNKVFSRINTLEI
ncbi:Na+/H+ antiporter NhaA [Terrisporobacter petrolearius]|uniref:Na+/H+ antiporter NhaA n=1 Tax=Terrisporobacter petrolearius TaxID=1460447 RepID=UPI003A7F380C